jgi:hypothetical protein
VAASVDAVTEMSESLHFGVVAVGVLVGVLLGAADSCFVGVADGVGVADCFEAEGVGEADTEGLATGAVPPLRPPMSHTAPPMMRTTTIATRTRRTQ